MPKYQLIPHPVDAIRWVPGVTIPNVEEVPTQIVYSRDRLLYYVAAPGLRSAYWLGTEKTPGPLTPEQQKASGLFDPGWLEITKSPDEVYRRAVYPFGVFAVRSGEREAVRECADPDLWQDYASLMKWPEAVPSNTGLLGLPDGTHERCLPGDWIVTDQDGVQRVVSDAAFHRTYEQIDDA